jgi:acetyltransferase-like isoleucine patch superfamily enzyme
MTIENFIKKPLGKLKRATFDRIKTKVNVFFLKRQNVGKDSYIDRSVQVLGWENVKIGNNSIIGEDVWININHRNIKTIGLAIGDNCFIGRRNFFNSGSSIEIGAYCLTAPNCSFLGADHLYTSPFVPYITSGITEGGAIEIGANCWLGANVTVLKDVKIGYGSIIGAGTLVNKNIPPLSVVVGNPGRIIKRFNMQQQTWVNVKEYSEDNDRDLMSEAEYLAILNETNLDLRGLWIASSKSFGDI